MALVAALVLASAVAAPTQAEQARTYSGRPVADVLQELQSADLKIIFSTDLVPPALRVKAEPKSKDRRDIAREILEPHGLALQPGPRGTLLVVPATQGPAAAPAAKASGHA